MVQVEVKWSVLVRQGTVLAAARFEEGASAKWFFPYPFLCPDLDQDSCFEVPCHAKVVVAEVRGLHRGVPGAEIGR